jgi:hypothetical protein
LAALSALLIAAAAGCWNTNIVLDHAWFDQPTSGPGGTSLSSTHLYDADGTHLEACNYGTDFACGPPQTGFPNGARLAYDAVGPNGENNRKGREGPYTTLTAADTPCTATDANGQPGHGWVGYGGFTPPTDACVDWFQGEITDDPNDSNTDEPMWRICAYPPTSGSPPTTASGANPRDCQPNGTGTLASTSPTNINTWVRAQFTGGTGTQGRANVIEFIYAVRDFYVALIHDPQISGAQADGHPGCISIYDFTPSGGTTRVRLQRLCP